MAFTQVGLEALTDPQLARWATKYGGWAYIHSNDQLRDPQGGMTTANNWGSIGAARRKQIIVQMVARATEAQIADITQQ